MDNTKLRTLVAAVDHAIERGPPPPARRRPSPPPGGHPRRCWIWARSPRRGSAPPAAPLACATPAAAATAGRAWSRSPPRTPDVVASEDNEVVETAWRRENKGFLLGGSERGLETKPAPASPRTRSPTLADTLVLGRPAPWTRSRRSGCSRFPAGRGGRRSCPSSATSRSPGWEPRQASGRTREDTIASWLPGKLLARNAPPLTFAA